MTMNFINLFIYWFWIILIIFFFLKNPLIMGLLLILNTFFLCIFILLFSYSSWNSYILFLMFLGGILILFLYNISLISVEVFQFMNFKSWFLILFMLFIMMNFMIFKQSFLIDMNSFFLKKEISPLIFFFYTYNLNTILFLVSYLFLSLIVIVNLIYLMKDKGSLRI